MDPKQIIAEMVEANGGPCVLDRIHLPYATAGSGPAAKFGFGCQLFLSDIDKASLRERSFQFLGDYWRTFSRRVNQLVLADQRRPVGFAGDPTDRLRADSRKFPLTRSYGAVLVGEVDIGVPKDDVPPYQADMLTVEEQSDELSFVSATMPVCNDEGEVNSRQLLDATLRWCGIARPVHGTAGFVLVFAPSMSQNTVHALQLMKRFPGFDLIDGVKFVRRAKGTHNRIKGVSWLTVLGEELVSELGGLQRIRQALEPACAIHPYDGGIVIQAGDEPRLGDTQRNDIPEHYRLVSRYTKPVRFEGYSKNGLFRVPENLDKVAATLQWVRRFD